MQNQMFTGQQGQTAPYAQQNFMHQGQGLLSQYGSDPQAVRQQFSQNAAGQSPMGSATQGYLANYAPAQASVMHAGATNPQIVQQHIQQDLGYAPTGHPAQQWQQWESQNGYAQQQAQAQQAFHGNPYNPSAFAQVMHSAPQQQTPTASFYGQSPQQYAPQSALAEFGSNPQTVRQHIQQDTYGATNAMTSPTSGYAQPAGATQYGAQSAQPTGMLSQYGTNPQTVRQHIQQDMNRYQ